MSTKTGFIDMFRPDRPFNDLPDLPPTEEIETIGVLKACISARAALAELKAVGELIPNQAILINSLPVLEAQASSEIENIVTTTDRLFRFVGRTEGDADPATREALRYRTALKRGFESLARRPLSTATAVEVCQTIKGVELDIRTTPGTTLVSETNGEVVYTPPEGEALLRNKLANWERFVHGEASLDPLTRLAVMHYQFEAIHPFIDGNGRTGRVLNMLFLVEQGLIDLPVLYLSRAIIRSKARYYDGLLKVTTEAAWEAWILFMIEAVDETARWTTAKIRAIRALIDRTSHHMRAQLPRIYSRELVETIFVHPYCRIGNLVEAGIAQRQSASVYLKAIAALGLLQEVKVGREKLYLNVPLLDLLADRA